MALQRRHCATLLIRFRTLDQDNVIERVTTLSLAILVTEFRELPRSLCLTFVTDVVRYLLHPLQATFAICYVRYTPRSLSITFVMQKVRYLIRSLSTGFWGNFSFKSSQNQASTYATTRRFRCTAARSSTGKIIIDSHVNPT